MHRSKMYLFDRVIGAGKVALGARHKQKAAAQPV
jgi:hypothetical protein